MKDIISASRRTDIPTFYYDWFQEKLKEEKVTVKNPIYPEKETVIDLSPDNVHSIVLWSKNFANVLRDPGLLENYNLYFQYTITGYSKLLEPNVPPYHESMKVLDALLKRYKPEQFNIRFDPIILSTNGELYPTPDKPGQARLKMFEQLCTDLHALGMDNCRVTTSYITMYQKARNNMSAAGVNFIELNEDQQIEFMRRMSIIAQKFNRDIYMCSNDRFVEAGIPNIKKGHCIDGDILSELFDDKTTKAKDQGQREECGCVKSKDIGSYLKCYHNCRYCYAVDYKN
jgi:DNA repair photolyase